MSREEQSKDGSFSENPQSFSSSFVGADAHIGPLGSCEFAVDLREYSAFCRADVGIGPYRVLRKSDSLPLYSDGIVSAWIGRITSAVNFPFSV